MYTINGIEIEEHDYYNIVSAVRGPDDNTHGFYGRALVIKSVTAVIVRRALFGAMTAADHSNPPVPHVEDFLKLSMDDIYGALTSHYIGHGMKALRALRTYKCALPEDLPLIEMVLNHFDGGAAKVEDVPF